MIYTTADRLMHIASAMETINREWSAQLKGMANYIRGLETTNINLYSELREAKQLIEETGNSIDDAELEAFADKVRDAHDVAIANECRKLDDAELASLNLPTYATLADLIASLP
jgi:hypothetical protein